jgi:phosphonate transport system substrate-binding protein
LNALRFASYLGGNGYAFYALVAGYLAQAVGLPVAMMAAPPEQAGAFARGDLEAAFTCGLPYVRHYAAEGARPLGAMVMAGERYSDRPVYFSDVIVAAVSPFQQFDDLRGAIFAYNQPESFSGYVLPRHHLRQRGQGPDFFGAWQTTGSHADSMNWVASGRAGAAAIDSVVLDMEFRQRPERARQLRVVASIGPMPMPPVVAAARLDPATHARLVQALTTMHRDPSGQEILEGAGVRRFAPMADDDYDPIRLVAQSGGS